VSNQTPVVQKEFQRIVGELLYVSRMTRPDISYAVARLTRRIAAPVQDDMDDARRILEYLRGTADEGVRLSGTGKIRIMVDAGEEDLEHKATSGILMFCGESLIGWSSRKQDVTTLSSTESEYLALSSAVQDALWVGKIAHDIGELLVGPPIVLLSDNKGAAQLAHNPEHHRRTRHIRRRHHFVRECVAAGEVTVDWIPGENNMADLLTKPLPGPRFHQLRRMMGVVPRDQRTTT
jgi:hypothetical protein